MPNVILQAPSLDAEQLRDFMNRNRIGTYTLLDVRQPAEYRSAHIPGGTLIPLPELPERVTELDPEKPVIVYCASGGRSKVAAQALLYRGFKEVYNLNGGIKAWHGLKAAGTYEEGLAFFASAETLPEVLSVAYRMEEALELFYSTLASSKQGEPKELLARLAAIEKVHKEKVVSVYRRINKGGKDSELRDLGPKENIMEGGLSMEEALKDKAAILESPRDILTAAMMLEAQALDLYARASREYSETQIRTALEGLVEEEKAHLAMLGKMLDKIP